MKAFDLQTAVDNVYAHYPAASRQPIIGITGNYEELSCRLARGYYDSVVKAGGTPVIIPPVDDIAVLCNTLDHVDALLLSGGGDINPLYCGEEPSPLLHGINAERDLPELLITRLACNRQLPILGICRGVQTLAIALGGKVAQDISLRTDAAAGTTIKHSQDADRSLPTHSVAIEQGSILYDIYHKEQGNNPKVPEKPLQIFVNSFHHQAVSDVGSHLRVTARATDGVIEAIESREYKSILGVQWHPECLEEGLPLFQWLVSEARSYREVQCLHDKVLTLDTHCDTPMFFPQQVCFGQRDPHLLVDLHKMTEGRQDATIMVSYLPQPKEGQSFAEAVLQSWHIDTPPANFPLPADITPTQYADAIFDKISDIAARYSDYLSLARTPADLIEAKKQGRKSIMLGIENGLALCGDPLKVEHFARRGVVYITLCHNGDNDICDSARGSHTHGGVSALGREVIAEMNRCGIMVDLSHANEQSFFDALDISATPIVCSHSSCRALCDHPRNLTDEQMRRLAARGGVMQVTLYHGFLRQQGEATILDAMAHLDHAVQIMGVDHVGLGTDFDGDGGVTGLADSSELLHFTRQLLARRYSIDDIRLLWGGNFLRVMSQVQSHS